MHFHGTEIQRPAPYYQIFKGRLFEQVDRAADFVLSVHQSQRRHARPERPGSRRLRNPARRGARGHRQRHRPPRLRLGRSGAGVRFRRPGGSLEPRRVAAAVDPERLREPHGSVPRNARICEALFLARYIEKYGTGTLMMIRESVEHSLPEPDFEQRAGEFTVTVWRDWLTEQVLAASDLNERQRSVVTHVKITGRVTSQDYQQLTGATPRTATRDLDDLVGKGLLRKVGKVGRGTHYVIQAKPDKNRTNRPSPTPETKSAINRTNRPSARRRKGGAGK